MLVLSGVVVAAFFSALLSGVKYVADPESQAAGHHLLAAGQPQCARRSRSTTMALPPIAVGGAGLLLLSWRLNVLAMGEEEARSLGVAPSG